MSWLALGSAAGSGMAPADWFIMAMAYRATIQLALFALLLLAAWRVGAGPERACAIILGMMPLADALYHVLFKPLSDLSSVEPGHLTIDLAAALALGWIALHANRTYPLWMAAFQLLALQAHVARLIAAEISPIAYFTMQVAPSYFQIVVLAVGIWRHRQRTLRHGRYRAWRHEDRPVRP